MATDSNPLTTLAVMKAWIGATTTTDDAQIQWAINAASRIVQAYCRRNFTEQRYYEIRDGNEAARIALSNYPVSVVRFVGVGWDSVMTVSSTVSTDTAATVSVDSDHLHLYRVTSTGAATSTTVTFGSHDVTSELVSHVNGETGFSASLILNVPSVYLRKLGGRSLRNGPAYLEAPTDALEDYQVDLDSGIVYGELLRGHRSLLVDYTAGFATIPSDVEQATLQIASRLFRQRKRDTAVASESLGGYSYSLRGIAEVEQSERMMLEPYRRRR